MPELSFSQILYKYQVSGAQFGRFCIFMNGTMMFLNVSLISFSFLGKPAYYSFISHLSESPGRHGLLLWPQALHGLQRPYHTEFNIMIQRLTPWFHGLLELRFLCNLIFIVTRRKSAPRVRPRCAKMISTIPHL